VYPSNVKADDRCETGLASSRSSFEFLNPEDYSCLSMVRPIGPSSTRWTISILNFFPSKRWKEPLATVGSLRSSLSESLFLCLD
jgi:hypothetical protein